MFHSIQRKEYGLAVGTHYGPTRIHPSQAGFSLRHRRDSRAGTTILHLVSAFYDRTKVLISDYVPAGAAGSWVTQPHPPGPQDRSTGLRAGGSSGKPPPKPQDLPRTTGRPGAADDVVDSAGAAVPFRDYGPDGSAGWLCRSTPRQADESNTRPCGSGPTHQSDVGILSQASTRRSTDRTRAG